MQHILLCQSPHILYAEVVMAKTHSMLTDEAIATKRYDR